MRLSHTLSVAAVAILVLAVSALAGVSIELRSGNKVRGTFEEGGEQSHFFLEVPEGAVLTVKVKSLKRGPAPELLFANSEDLPIAHDQIVETKNSALLRKFVVPATDRYVVAVSARDGESVGEYALVVKWKSPKTVPVSQQATSEGTSIAFAADGGARLNLAVKAGKGSPVVPRVDRIEGPGGLVLTPGPGKAARATLRKFELPETGDYELFLANDADEGGEVRGKLKIAPPKSRAKVDLTAQLIESPLGATAAVGRIVTRTGATLRVDELAAGDEELDGILGTILDVPADALPSATPIVIATGVDLEPRALGGIVPTPGGPAVNFGPDGLRFERPATITLPIDAPTANDPDSVVVFTQSGRGRPQQVDGVTVDTPGQTVSFPVSHFSTYQVFRLVDPDAPFVLDATIEEFVSGAAADFVNRLAAYPSAGFAGGGPGVIYASAVSQGLVALDIPGRSGSRAPQTIPVDSFVAQIAYRPSDGRIYAVVGSQVFIVSGGTLELYAGASASSGPSAGDGGPALTATFGQIRDIVAVPDGVLVAELNRVRKVLDSGATSGNVEALYGQSGGSTAEGVDPALAGFQSIIEIEPTGAAGDELLITELGRVRLVGGSSAENRTLVGGTNNLSNAAEDQPLLEARFDGITSSAFDAARNVIYLSDDFNGPIIYAADLDRDVVRRLAGTPFMTGVTPAGTAAPAVLDFISDLAVVGDLLIWSEGVNDRILFLDFNGGNPF